MASTGLGGRRAIGFESGIYNTSLFINTQLATHRITAGQGLT